MEGLSDIARQGILGALLVAAIMAIGYLYKHGIKFQKECSALQDSRIEDWKEIAETVRANSMVMRDWVAANEQRTRAIEATVRAQELIAETIKSNSTMMATSYQNLAGEVSALSSTIQNETERYSQVIRDATASHRELREAILSRGIKL